MTEMDPLFREMIDTLAEARRAVREELDRRVAAESQDSAALKHLDESVHSLSGQADSLLLMMRGREPTSPLLETAKDLSDFFEAAESEVEALPAASQG